MMKLLSFWRRPIPENSLRAAFSEGLFMALILSFYWLIGSSIYFLFWERNSLTPLAIIFFGTTFFAVPACVLGGFTAAALYGLLPHFPRPLTEAQSVIVGILFGVFVIAAGMIALHTFFLTCVPGAVGCALYLALCGRMAAKIQETNAGPLP